MEDTDEGAVIESASTEETSTGLRLRARGRRVNSKKETRVYSNWRNSLRRKERRVRSSRE